MSPAGSYAEAWVVGLSRHGQSLNQGHGGSSEGSTFLKEKTGDDTSGENSGGVISDGAGRKKKDLQVILQSNNQIYLLPHQGYFRQTCMYFKSFF